MGRAYAARGFPDRRSAGPTTGREPCRYVIARAAAGRWIPWHNRLGLDQNMHGRTLDERFPGPEHEYGSAMTRGLDREQWLVVLTQLARFLDPSGPPIRLCLIGSVACVFGGMAARTSRDIDVWKPASDYDFMELHEAVEAAGLAFDPKTTLDPAKPYVQLVEPGPTQVGTFEPVLVEKIGRLEVYRPPIENLIASKLARGDARDVEDVIFLANKFQPSLAAVRSVAETFRNPGRRQALENLVYLELADGGEANV